MFLKSDTPNPDKPEPNPDSEIRNWGICLKLRYSYFEFFLPKNTKITTKELITPHGLFNLAPSEPCKFILFLSRLERDSLYF